MDVQRENWSSLKWDFVVHELERSEVVSSHRRDHHLDLVSSNLLLARGRRLILDRAGSFAFDFPVARRCR